MFITRVFNFVSIVTVVSIGLQAQGAAAPPGAGNSCTAHFEKVRKACSEDPYKEKWPGPPEPVAKQGCEVCKSTQALTNKSAKFFENTSKKCKAAISACHQKCASEVTEFNDKLSAGQTADPKEYHSAMEAGKNCEEYGRVGDALKGQGDSYVTNAAKMQKCINKTCPSTDPAVTKTDPPGGKEGPDGPDGGGKDGPSDGNKNAGGGGGDGGQGGGDESKGGGGGGGGMGDMMSALGPLMQALMQQQPEQTPPPNSVTPTATALPSVAPIAATTCTQGQFMNSQGACQNLPQQLAGVGAMPMTMGGGPITTPSGSSSSDDPGTTGSPYQPVAGGGNAMAGMEGAKGSGGGGLSLTGSGGNSPQNFGGNNRAVGDPQAAGLSSGGGSGGGGGGGGGGWNGGKSDSPGSRGFNIGFNSAKKDRMPASVKIFGKNVPVGKDGVTGAMGPAVWEKLGSAYKDEYMGNGFINDP
jgi:uncharacterized membrane protein YgcG